MLITVPFREPSLIDTVFGSVCACGGDFFVTHDTQFENTSLGSMIVNMVEIYMQQC